jgi:hypothetical protein
MSVRWNKRLIDSVRYEAAAVFDVDNDGVLDIVSGEYWWKGPDYRERHKICDVQPVSEWYDDFSDYGLDVNGDSWLDIVTGGWWGQTLRWRENPHNNGPWLVHDIDKCGSIETIRYLDIDHCGVPEIFPNTPGEPQCFYKLETDEQGRGTGQFRKVVIGEAGSGHGMGFGDVNGNGRTDIILSGGWLEQPEDLFKTPWTLHPEFDLGSASVPILGYDVNGDGLLDLIAGKAHDYGLAWWEQQLGPDGTRSWHKHDIDTTVSQCHDLWLVDIDGDGELEVVTGKRYRAHGDGDPGTFDPLGIYYFKIKRDASGEHVFEKHIVDYGSADRTAGCGLYFWVQDINGDGRLDIVAPGKSGLYLFENLG